MIGNERIAFFFVEVIRPHGNSYNHVYVVSEVSTIMVMYLTSQALHNLANLSLFLVLYLSLHSAGDFQHSDKPVC